MLPGLVVIIAAFNSPLSHICQISPILENRYTLNFMHIYTVWLRTTKLTQFWGCAKYTHLFLPWNEWVFCFSWLRHLRHWCMFCWIQMFCRIRMSVCKLNILIWKFINDTGMCFIEVHKSNFQKRSCAREEVDNTFVVKSGIPLEMEKEIYAVSILYILK